MSFELIYPFKEYVWKKIQDDVRKDHIPHSDQINYMRNDGGIMSVSWEITKNALTSDVDISVFIEGLPEKDSEKDTAVIDVQISIPSQDSCSIESVDVNIANWSESLDKEYDSLSEKIQQLWNSDKRSTS